MDERLTLTSRQRRAVAVRVRRRREELRLSQVAVAERVGRSRRWLLDVEAGRCDFTLTDLLLLAEVLRTDLAWLLSDLLDEPEELASARLDGRLGSKEEITERRTFHRLAIFTTLGAMAGAIDLDRLVSLDAGRPVDGATLDDLALVTDGYARQWKVLPPGNLLPGVHGHLRLLTSLRARDERRLHGLTADTAVLAGYLAFQLEDRGRAAGYWTTGRELANDIGAEPRARVLVALSAQRSQLAHGLTGASAASIALLDEAEHAAGPAASSLLRAWIFARRAEERAALGDGAGCDRDIELAAASLDEPSPRTDAIIGPSRGSHLDGFRGNCALLLGRPEAVGILRRSLDAMPVEMVAWRSVIHCDLAAALADQGEVEAACDTLSSAYRLAIEVGAAEHVQRVHGIRRRLDRHAGAPPVRQLDELIAS